MFCFLIQKALSLLGQDNHYLCPKAYCFFPLSPQVLWGEGMRDDEGMRGERESSKHFSLATFCLLGCSPPKSINWELVSSPYAKSNWVFECIPCLQCSWVYTYYWLIDWSGFTRGQKGMSDRRLLSFWPALHHATRWGSWPTRLFLKTVWGSSPETLGG